MVFRLFTLLNTKYQNASPEYKMEDSCRFAFVNLRFATPRSERAPGKGSMKGMMLGLERVAEARGWSRVRKRETRKHHEH